METTTQLTMTAPETHEALTSYLKDLRLPTIRANYKEEAERARKEPFTHEQYLLALIEREVEVRQIGRIQRYRRESGIPGSKTWESFERDRLPQSALYKIEALLQGDFLKRAENVLVFGAPGSGKTHLVCAMGHEWITRGHRVLFTRCGLLVQELLRAKQGYLLEKRLKKLSRYEALIIDDIGYVQHDREEMEVLFTLLAERYERSSIVLTSNLPFSKWETIFKDPMTTAAAIDRLVHHSVILELNLTSYRLEAAKRRTDAPLSLPKGGPATPTPGSGKARKKHKKHHKTREK